ncbi:ADP-ribosylglycohydrolase family protein [Arthrobacter agilis]|uniref:ADP-ribosylglycohydrolase family protein n=1 Tax=Arthrobacter agilis TaxID=37921 RepID=UPI0023673DC8|nr:ADP-ribosylglycohydrolase family protein [Arthrobacter agilis]WDF32287.1 ADP-ribosylglycohydrolase family protein [Arthrobacter agilis]
MTTDSSAPVPPTDAIPGPGSGDAPGPAGAATSADRVLGCLLGTMAGDAYGVLHAAGEDPTAALRDPTDLRVSDATQLTLYTVDGLVDALEWANDGVAADETACLWLAYLRWLVRQGEPLPANAPAAPARWLDRQEGLLPVRDPDAETMRALRTGEMGTRARPLNLQADGAGALMRSAPFGLVPRIPESMVERLTVGAAALTHGDDGARTTAARFSAIVRALAIDGLALDEAVHRGGGDAHEPATARAADGAIPAEGTTAEAVFDSALQSVLVRAEGQSSPQEHLAAALAHAAAGRSDASAPVRASLAGGLVGALHGTAALPAAYLEAPGVAAVVRGMARSLLKATTGT